MGALELWQTKMRKYFDAYLVPSTMKEFEQALKEVHRVSEASQKEVEKAVLAGIINIGEEK